MRIAFTGCFHYIVILKSIKVQFRTGTNEGNPTV